MSSGTIFQSPQFLEDPIAATPISIAYFITPHGFGHAARACAIILALRKRTPGLRFHLFTTVPAWFFTDSLGDEFTYHSFVSDIGLVQDTPFTEDLPTTAKQWYELRRSMDGQIANVARILQETHCKFVICDTAPTGILAARKATIPSVLIENFTWDFIYSDYSDQCAALLDHARYLQEVFAAVDYHIQAVPVCNPDERFLQVFPIFRPARSPREVVRRRLGIGISEKVIFITTGGIPSGSDRWEYLNRYDGIHFILPGNGDETIHEKNLTWLPHHSPFYPPDLIHASDAVIAKLGYSTVAEVYSAGVPFAYIPRESFPETPVLAEFVRTKLGGIELSFQDFVSGCWGDLPQKLINMPKTGLIPQNGADQACDLISQLIDN